jgi:putative Mg2+ transporter-C (MgtC) family protein
MNDLFSTFLGHVEHASAATTVAAVALRLAVAALFGGVIGIERQLKHRPAGLRTNMFICFGAALFTIVSSLMAGGQEDTRIAAQIVTGIGFIGGGVILRAGGTIQGVTTAATIFVVAAIGMCAGSGLLFPATIATVFVVFGLLVLGVLEQHVFGRYAAVAYTAGLLSPADLPRLLKEAQAERNTRLVDVSFSLCPQGVEAAFILDAAPATHVTLQARLRQELAAHTITKFSCSVQE